MTFVEFGRPQGLGVDRSGATEERCINLDANANAPVTKSVIEAVTASMHGPTNPSSGHFGGAQARNILAAARDAVARLAVGVVEDGVIFTSGCTEANNTVLGSVKSLDGTLVTTAVEHPSILSPARSLASQGVPVAIVPVQGNGVIDLDRLAVLLDQTEGAILLSIQTANSETGVIQPINAIAELIRARDGVLFHTDAAQSFGKLPLHLASAGGPNVATMSGHKLHAPMGIGAIMLAPGEDRIGPILLGGEQQHGLRAGTEPLPLVAGLGAACADRAQRMEADVALMTKLRDRLEERLLEAVPGAAINGADAPRLPNTSSVRFPGTDAMALVAHLDHAGVLVSQGSACASMRPTPSHVLLAMGLSEAEAFSTVRFSVSPLNSMEEIEQAVEIVTQVCRRLGSFA